MNAMKFYKLVGQHLSAVNQVQQDHLNEKIDTATAHAMVDVLLQSLKDGLDETPAAPAE